ncbi:MAG TPA: helix-turn-helix domain-containing protein [Gammaproteobacteria bacterium]|nr:helix-turn-helix domain-containing protein [Gammaproteobacteria bacterium]
MVPAGAVDAPPKTLVTKPRILRAGEVVFWHGSPLRSLYVVWTGWLKSGIGVPETEPLIGLHLPGDWLGLESIHSGFHVRSAVALETSEVCAVPFTTLNAESERDPALQRWLCRLLSREMLRSRAQFALCSGGTVRQRLAGFLLALSQRFQALGYDPSEFPLPLTLAEIGSYLGLVQETVCRSFAAFRRRGWVTVDRRRVRIDDPHALVRPLALGPETQATREPGAKRRA